MPIDHVPASYVPVDLGNATLWASPSSAEVQPGHPVGELVRRCIEDVEQVLGWTFGRHVHVVVYATGGDAREALDRDVAPTFLMAPRHAEDHAVIIMHSATLDSKNADPDRIRRLLCHELAHVAAAEKTGSLKRLGDNGRDMRIRPWVDEGFAVCVGAIASGQPEALERTINGRPSVDMTLCEVDVVMNELASPRRAEAFSVATSMVWDAVMRHGFEYVFERLDGPEGWMHETRPASAPVTSRAEPPGKADSRR